MNIKKIYFNFIFLNTNINFNIECNVTHNHNLCKDKDKIDKKIGKTIIKMNAIKNYKIYGDVLKNPKSKKNFGDGNIIYNFKKKTLENIDEIHSMMNVIINNNNKDKDEKMNITLKLSELVEFITKSIQININKENVVCKIKYGLLPTIKKTYKINEDFEVLKQLVSPYFSLENIEYVILDSKDNKNTAIIFFNKKQKTNKIENFFIILLGEKKYKKKYHIHNIIGLIFAIDGKVIISSIDKIE